ncbi:MSHA biogenesis protein MshJ [Undibacterium fentianense]|uniref:MSHA biogenesis protein MshJ n=1 Tax=Undibacterium fentianense TaxID=2828728 RepID=A0A941E311_9BURK|nr:MSHA biogenesis protein MshJ [Undibacterium fentianense]MBR7800066.1 MSHA biogenesis protein MshJ [Undibacterium fentianense]
MSASLKSLLQKIDALSLRERVILFILMSLGLVLLGYTFLIEPQQKLQKSLKAVHLSNQQQIAIAQEEVNQRLAALKIDPDAELKAKITEAKLRLTMMDQDLLKLEDNLVRPDKMDGLLSDMFKRNKKLQWISTKSLPVVNLMELPSIQEASIGSEGADSNPRTIALDDRSIYKHEVELVLQGNYLDMLAYMRALEAMPQRVYWGRSSLTVLEYPKASLSLHLFTLSLEKKWLNL